MTACVNQLWPDVVAQSAQCPISWEDVSAARRFLQGFFVQPFDHNISHLSIICMKVPRNAAREPLDLDKHFLSRPTLSGNAMLTLEALWVAWL